MMKNNNTLTRILAIAGNALVWIPVLLPVIFLVGALLQGRGWRLDFLMPGELFPLVLAGGALLLVAAWRAGTLQKFIGWVLAAVVFFLVGSQVLAVVSGVASDASKEGGAWWVLVVVMLIVYDLLVVALGVGGIRLLRRLYPPPARV